MAWPLKVYSFALLISEAETANLDTSSGEQKLGDAVYTKWRVSLLIVGSFLFRSPPIEVLNLVLKSCLSFEATHSTEPCYVWNWEAKSKKDGCPIPVKDMLSDLILSITWKCSPLIGSTRSQGPAPVNLHNKKCKQNTMEKRIYILVENLQPIKEPSLKCYPFLLFNAFSLIQDRNISLVKVY